jgi:hypothetical protein
MTVLAIALANTPPEWFKPPPILAGLCILKAVNPSLFAKAKLGTLTYAEVADALYLETPVHAETAVLALFG